MNPANLVICFSARGPGRRKTCYRFTRQSNSARSTTRRIHPWLEHIL